MSRLNYFKVEIAKEHFNTCHFSQCQIEGITERSLQTRISFSFSTYQVAYQYLHCTTKFTLYLRTDIDIERHSVSVQSTFATCTVYKLHREVGSVLIIHFMLMLELKA